LWAEGALTYRQLLTVLILSVILPLATSAAYADTLHGYCVAPAAPCIDNNTITPTGANPRTLPLASLGNAHKNGSGNIWLIDLVPDNHNSGFPLTLNGVNTTNSHVAGSLFSATEWNSGFLSAYLSTFNFGHPSYPLNPVPRESIRARMATRLSLRLRRIQLQDGTRRSYFQRKQRSCTTGIDIPRCADEVRHSECQCGHSEQCFHLGNGYSGSRTQYLATQGETMKDCPKCKDIDQTYSDWNK